MKEDENGWHDVLPAVEWKCPECGITSPVEDWEGCVMPCEDCGEHDGRECPNCGEQFDHVWGATSLAETQWESIS